MKNERNEAMLNIEVALEWSLVTAEARFRHAESKARAVGDNVALDAACDTYWADVREAQRNYRKSLRELEEQSSHLQALDEIVLDASLEFKGHAIHVSGHVDTRVLLAGWDRTRLTGLERFYDGKKLFLLHQKRFFSPTFGGEGITAAEVMTRWGHVFDSRLMRSLVN